MRCRVWLVFLLLLFWVQTVWAAQVVFLDVGQGDAILIISDQGGAMLIDAGTRTAGRAVVVPFLLNLGIDSLDVVVMTHPHADHIGGLIPVLEEIPVQCVYANYEIHTTETYKELLLLIETLDIPFIRAEPGMEIEIAGIDRIEILHPSYPLSDDINNNSIVILMETDGISFLFTGDIEKKAEEYLIQQAELAAHFVKVPHHGSKTSSHLGFLMAVEPNKAIISCGEGNSYGHPDLEVLLRYTAFGVDIYRTDIHGAITVLVEDGTVDIKTQKSSVRLPAR
ncbi:MAG TPA: MBL fold metallo-hydrolase [Firmicutes bacterium]|nr:MBL fold metallo-hydrolase [Bacillota bacterium]